jgi:hypothetical protein
VFKRQWEGIRSLFIDADMEKDGLKCFSSRSDWSDLSPSRDSSISVCHGNLMRGYVFQSSIQKSNRNVVSFSSSVPQHSCRICE